jgi:hypothetical protein
LYLLDVFYKPLVVLHKFHIGIIYTEQIITSCIANETIRRNCKIV